MTELKIDGLGQSARDWVSLALDPYHDVSVAMEGLPDSEIGRSYVRCHNQAVTLAASADGDNFSVIFTGMHGNASSMGRCVLGTRIDSTPAWDLAPVIVLRTGMGVDPSLTNISNGTATTIARFGTTLTGSVPSRLIALAVEIHDVSASLYKKGTLTGAHCAGAHEHADVARNYGPALADMSQWFIEHCDTQPLLPASLTRLQSYPGVVTVPLARGAYAVARMSMPARPARFEGTSYWHRGFQVREYGSNYMAGAADVPTLGSTWGPAPSGFLPFVLMGSGLPSVGEYRITLRTYVEYFPEPDDLTNLAISTPSPPYCPEALRLYHDALATLPGFVPVNSNAAGDWWRKVVAVVRASLPHVAPLALTAMGQPGMAALVRGLTAVSASSGRAQNVPRQKSKRAKQKGKKTRPLS
jgi:hypothetical protein